MFVYKLQHMKLFIRKLYTSFCSQKTIPKNEYALAAVWAELFFTEIHTIR